MRTAVLVDGGQPGRAGVDRVRSRRRPRSELRNNCGPIHRRQPVHRTQIDDLHEASLHCPGHILADGISYVRRATTAELIADVVTLLGGLGRDTVRGEWADTAVGLDGNDANIAVLQTPDGHGRLELFESIHHPDAIETEPTRPTRSAAPVAFSVDDIDEALEIA